jgi:hypothetical protein
VAADGPLGWGQNGEMNKVSYHDQTTGTASYPLYSGLLLHTELAGRANKGP